MYSESQAVKDGIDWLIRKQDSKGCIGMRSDPDWVLDHAMATYVLAEGMRMSEGISLFAVTNQSIDALRDQIESVQSKVGKVGNEVRLWSEIITRSWDHTLKMKLTDLGEERYKAGMQACHNLRTCVLSLPSAKVETMRDIAAQHLREALVNWETRSAAAPLDLGEPLEDPLRTFYVLAAAWHLGGDHWRNATRGLGAHLDTKRVQDGEERGSWDPAGAFGSVNGRFGTTAMGFILRRICYRIIDLDLFRIE